MFKIKLTTLYFILSLLLTPMAYYTALYNDAPKQLIVVNVTMYNAVEKQCDADPLVTAAMYKINPLKASSHRWVAISRNLHHRWGGNLKFGDKIYIYGAGHKDGIYTVADIMNERYKNTIDILETSGTKHYEFKDVIIEKVNI